MYKGVDEVGMSKGLKCQFPVTNVMRTSESAPSINACCCNDTSKRSMLSLQSLTCQLVGPETMHSSAGRARRDGELVLWWPDGWRWGWE